MLDELGEATDRTCHDGPAVGHRFGTGEPETLTSRGTDHDRGAVVEAGELVAWHESERIRHLCSERAVACHDESKACSGCQEILDALLFRQPPGEENLGRSSLRLRRRGDLDAVRDYAGTRCA